MVFVFLWVTSSSLALGTQCPTEKQAARLALKMKGRAEDIVLGIPIEQLKAEG